MTRDPNAETRAELRRWIAAEQRRDAFDVNAMKAILTALLDEIDAAQRFIFRFANYTAEPLCWKCEVLEERGSCRCEIAANE